MNRWLYRAVGTVGIAGGALVFGAGAAQADQTDLADTALADVFSPTGGLPPLELTSPDPVAPEVGGLTLDPADGRATQEPEVLPGLPLGGLDSLLGGLPLGGLPLGGLPLDGLPLGGAPLDGLPVNGLPTDAVGPMMSQTAGNLPLVSDVVPAQPNAQDARTLPAGPTTPGLDPAGGEQLPPVIADQLAAEGRFSPELLGTAHPGDAEITGAIPLLGPALEPVSKLVGVGNLADQLPVVGPVAGSALGGLPVVEPPAGRALDPSGNPAPGTASERPVTGEDPEFSPTAGRSAESLPAGPAEFLPVDPVTGLTQQLPMPLPLPLGALGSLPVLSEITGGLPV